MHAPSQSLLSDALRLHGLGNLPSDNALESGTETSSRRLAQRGIVEVGADMLAMASGVHWLCVQLNTHRAHHLHYGVEARFGAWRERLVQAGTTKT